MWRKWLRGPGPVLVTTALGGGLGAAARYGAELLWPTAPGAFPWATLGINAVGCAMIGVLMVVVSSQAWAPHRLVRPFFGTGVLGGFTTFSAYVGDIRRLVDQGRATAGLAYLALMLVVSLAAVWSASAVTRHLNARRRERHRLASHEPGDEGLLT
ncbi:fluoride efflux transporter FluC [Streptomyces ipomoeae]|nr:CrcB family protein [Streptomyces ipomoeae]MDX2699644.1 CrcB family protein [Streptomyces ipomoeae]MDX2845356.1 CrcB family protein [Streptomyces ipomoeae]MDX2935613.1 CrcB family protein [Streptomyces ipomoeae]